MLELFQTSPLSPEAKKVLDELNKLKQQRHEHFHNLPTRIHDELFHLHDPNALRRTHRPPNYLRSTNDSVREQFSKIWQNPKLSDDEKQKESDQLAARVLNSQQMSEYKKHVDEMTKMKQDLDLKVRLLLSIHTYIEITMLSFGKR